MNDRISKQTQSRAAQSTKKALRFCIGALVLLTVVLLVGCNSNTADTTGTIDTAGTTGTAETAETTGTTDNQQKTNVIAKGEVAPDFDLTLADGTQTRLSDFQGQIVLLNFWAKWCGYCIEEMPDIQQIADDYPDVEILAVNRGDASSKATSFIEGSNYDFSWALDEDGKIESLYPASGIPYTIIIDKDGVITTIFEGGGSGMYSRFEKAILSAGAVKP